MRKLVVFAGLLAAPAGTAVESQSAAKSPATERDPRTIRIRNFFEEKDCPLSGMALDFVRAADANSLDWRLLPSISFIESSGGKHLRRNNAFGWNSCRTRFPSMRAGIRVVAANLGRSRLYKDKRLDQILETYNPRPGYAVRVKSVMHSMGPERPETEGMVTRDSHTRG